MAEQMMLVLDAENEAGQFLARPSAPRWAMIKFAKAQRSSDDTEQAVAVYDVVMASLLPSETDRFEEYMSGDDERFDALEKGLDRLVHEWAGLPFEQSPSSSVTETPTSQGSRVISLQQGTVQVDESPSPASS